jgi:hypothetical protein
MQQLIPLLEDDDPMSAIEPIPHSLTRSSEPQDLMMSEAPDDTHYISIDFWSKTTPTISRQFHYHGLCRGLLRLKAAVSRSGRPS